MFKELRKLILGDNLRKDIIFFDIFKQRPTVKKLVCYD